MPGVCEDPIGCPPSQNPFRREADDLRRSFLTRCNMVHGRQRSWSALSPSSYNTPSEDDTLFAAFSVNSSIPFHMFAFELCTWEVADCIVRTIAPTAVWARWCHYHGRRLPTRHVHILRQDPPLDLSFWSFLTFLHHGIEKIERHLLWKFYKKIRRKGWSKVLPKLVACIGFLYKVVHKIGRLRKFNRSRGI